MFIGDFGGGEGVGFGLGSVAVAGDHADDFFDHVAGFAGLANVDVDLQIPVVLAVEFLTKFGDQ